jgi:glycogen debranching enzyme
MTRNSLEQEGYQRALMLLHECATPDGFVASPSKHDNYRRIWSRDGAIIALAALLSGDGELIRAARHTFETLAARQGPHGEIPTNVDIASERVSYGGTTGRVDADLWFIIGAASTGSQRARMNSWSACCRRLKKCASYSGPGSSTIADSFMCR